MSVQGPLTRTRRAAESAPRTMRREFCPNADACVRSFEALGLPDCHSSAVLVEPHRCDPSAAARHAA